MEIDEETNQKIQNLQLMEQGFQSLLVQKQTFQIELNEINNAVEEIGKAKGDVFKIIGQIMLKADKNELKKDLLEKKSVLEVRLKSIDKQELSFREDVERIRGEIVNKLK